MARMARRKVVIFRGLARILWGKVASSRLYELGLLSEGCGRPRRPCPRLLHSEPFQARRGNGFQPEVSGGSWGPRPHGAAAGGCGRDVSRHYKLGRASMARAMRAKMSSMEPLASMPQYLPSAM